MNKVVNNRVLIAVIILLLTVGLIISLSFNFFNRNTRFFEHISTSAQNYNISGTIQFRIFSPGGKPIENARVIVVNYAGNILFSGLTKSDGQLSAAITTEKDQRFTQDIGVVTAIAVADGYNEQVVFEVPVSNETTQSIVLKPLKSGERNEPQYELGNIHRLLVFDLIDKIAKQIGLSKQPKIQGDEQEHWSPKIGNK